MNEYLKEILTEMCRRVNAPFSVVNSTKDWYLKYSWTLLEEESFENWLVEYLKTHKEARKLMRLPTTKKKELKRFAKNFTSNYGWTLSNAKISDLMKNYNSNTGTTQKTTQNTTQKTTQKT